MEYTSTGGYKYTVASGKNKITMMWGDVLLNHFDKIDRIPEDTVFLNWFYRENPTTEQVEKFYTAGRKQILCVGTSNWARYCENTDMALLNIENMTRLGYQFGAKGTFTSLWGDYGNTASLALSECSFAFGADRVWNVEAQKEDIFGKVDKLIYKAEGLSEYAQELSALQTELPWVGLILLYEDGYVKHGKRINQGDLVINIHIPSTGIPLTKEIIDETFSKAYEFYRDMFEDGIVPFILRSWLLYEKHREFLPPTSNILTLMDYFDILYSNDDEKFMDWWRVFNKPYNNNIDEMPADTSLRRAFVDWVKKGNYPGRGGGIFMYHPDFI